MKVVIVESPAKAKTINKYLGKGYDVYASFGHVRDLTAKDGSVDPGSRFRHALGGRRQGRQAAERDRRRRQGRRRADPRHRPRPRGRGDFLARLEILKAKKIAQGQARRPVVFNAVTKEAVQDAMRHPREIDEALVDAYRARRALDYLVGFNLSPVLWRKLPGRARRGACNRSRCASSATAKSRSRDSSRANTGRSSRI